MIKHRYSIMSTDQCLNLNVFADARMKAYDVMAYLQSAEQVDFIKAKSRVSTLKDPHCQDLSYEQRSQQRTLPNLLSPHCRLS